MAGSANGTVSSKDIPSPVDSPRKAVPENVPHIVEIKKTIPKYCFEGDLRRSLYYVFKDLTIVIALYVGMLMVEMQPFTLLKYLYTPIYWFLQGTIFWGIFVLGHDCGHGSFSNYYVINEILGNILHSFILVPFTPWKLSHKHHHRYTANIDKDEVFYPVRDKDCDYSKDHTPFVPLFGFGLSWFIYLCVGYAPRNCNHFNPYHPLFENHVRECMISLGCWGTMVYMCYWYWSTFGFLPLLVHYLLPVFVFGSWLVVVTFLHHHDTNVPWYADHEWDNVRGQLSSVDFDYGWAHELTHNIGTHQIHHLFAKIPHYHLELANYHFKKAYPHLSRFSGGSILPSFVKMFYIYQSQYRIRDDTAIHVYTPNK